MTPTASVVESIGMIARWKPVHLGHAAVLEGLVARARHAFIGIGSSNKYDARNPFTADETAEMIRAALTGCERFTLVRVPDLDHGPRWRAMVLELFPKLELFVTENDRVRALLERDFAIVHPATLVPRERRVAIDGTMVRAAMARGDGWRALVPDAVAALIDERALAARFRREFGLATLALDAPAS